MNVMNPFINATKRFIHDLIGAQRYANHEETLEQVSRQFNQKEYERFGKLIAEIYEAGYMRAVEEHQVELKKVGLKVIVKNAPTKPSQPIFKNSLDNS